MAVAPQQQQTAPADAGAKIKSIISDAAVSHAVLSYVPNEEQYQARQSRNLRDPNRVRELPEGFPEKAIANPSAWEGKDMLHHEERWRVELDDEDLLDADRALKEFQASGLPPSKITRETFQLQSKLASKLENASVELHQGQGFSVFGGLRPEQYSAEENVLLFAGLMSYIGSVRGYHTPENNDVIGHVHDLTPYYPKEEIHSPTSTRTKMPFHTDNADVLALYVLSSGERGGTFKIASSGLVYNILAAERPDLVDVLSKDYLFDCYIDNYEPYSRPLLFHHDDKLMLQCFRRPFTGFSALRRRVGLPALTATQAEALDAIHFTAEKHCLPIEFRNGDVVLIHNFSVLHARDEIGSVVSGESEVGGRGGVKERVAMRGDKSEMGGTKRRHLLKMFLRDEGRAWALPRQLERDWEVLYGFRGVPGGEREEMFRAGPQVEGRLSNGWVQNG